MTSQATWPLRFVVVAEDVPDTKTARVLAERVIIENVEWLQGQSDAWRWTGVSSGSEFLKWANVKKLAERSKMRVFGFTHGKPNHPDALAARKALALIRESESELGPVSAVLLVRDLDNQTERLDGLRQARNHVCSSGSTFRVVIGAPNPKREAWLLVAYRPRSPRERTLLKDLRMDLGYDPTSRAHELSAAGDKAKNSVKRVLGDLTEGHIERAEEDFASADLDCLRQPDDPTNLASFLDELARSLPSLFDERHTS